MTVFSDDFNRADGPVGNGWTVNGFQTRIVSGQVTATSYGRIARIVASGSAYHHCEFDAYRTGTNQATSQPMVKSNGDRAQCYAATIGVAGGAITWSIGYYVSAVYTGLANGTAQQTPTNPARIKLIYNSGQLSLYYNGILIGQATDNRYATNDHIGVIIPASTFQIDDLYATTDLPVALDATPEPMIQLAVEQQVQFTGTGTAWVAGQPGEPIFTVDKGELSAQEVLSSTQAQANYLPPQADDVATFTDPSTGQTDAVALSTGFQVNAGGSGSADEYFDVLEAGMISPQLFLEIFGFLQSLFDSPQEPGSDLITYLYNGSPDVPGWTDFEPSWARLYTWITAQSPWSDPTGDDLPTKLLSILQTAQDAVVSADYTNVGQTISLHDVLGEWGDVNPTIYFLAQQLAAIRTLNDYTFQDVIDYLYNLTGGNALGLDDVEAWFSSLRGPNSDSLYTLMSRLNLITSDGLYGLNDVATWINNVRGVSGRDLTDIYNYLSTIRGDSVTTLSAIYNAITGIEPVDLTHVLADLDVIISNLSDLSAQESGHYTTIHDQLVSLEDTVKTSFTGVNAKLNTIIAKEDSILAAIAAIRPADYPLWPGAGNVTLGTPVTGVADLSIPGPLDGLLIDCSVWPRDIEAWTNGGRRALKYAGHITFVSDIAYTEEIQFPATDKRVVVPKSMLTAASALVHLRVGVTATITPWSYTP